MAQCILDKCTGDIFSRGLCREHYIVAFDLVKRCKTSWVELEHKGRAIPKCFDSEVSLKTTLPENVKTFLED